ncbi:MAG TPA: ATP-binding protein [Chitinophagaceae bacterium]
MAVLTLIISVTILVSLYFYDPGIDHGSPGISTVSYNTTLCFILSAIALFFYDQQNFNRFKKSVALICTFIVLMMAALTLSEHIFKFNVGIDDLFWKETFSKNASPGRMSSTTTVLFLLLTITNFLLNRRRLHLFVQIILIAGFGLLALIFLVSISVADFNKLSFFNASTLHASLAFLLLYVGTFFSYPLSYLHFSFEKRMIANFLFTILLLIIIFFSFRNTGKKSSQTAQWVTDTHEVLLNAAKIRTEVIQMQNSIRGYYLTSGETYLSSFNSTSTSVIQHIQQLRKRTSENPEQQARMDTLQKLVTSYIKSRKEIVETYRNPQLAPEKMNVYTKDGTELAGQIIKIIDSFQQHANQMLVSRKAQNDQNATNSSKAIGLLQIVTGILIIAFFVVIYINIRKRKKAEQQLKEMNAELGIRVEEKTKEVIGHEKQYRFLIENMQEGIQLIGFDWRYIFVNKAYRIQRGKPDEELIGQDLLKMNPQIENLEFFTLMQRCMKERLSAHIEHENENGFFELSIQPVPRGLLILSMDITESKKYLQELIKREAQLANAQQIAKLANWEWDITRGPVNPSPQMLNLLCLPAGLALTPETFFNCIYPEDRQQFKRELNAALANGTNLNSEFSILNDGEPKYMHIFSRIVVDKYGHPSGFNGTIQDVTILKKSEAMLKQLNRNLEQRALELRASNTELERFAFVASHDLQEPLRMVTSFLSLLEEETQGTLNEDSLQYIQFAINGAERMKKLIDALLEYSRLGATKEAVTAVDCNQVIASVKKLLTLKIQESNAILHVANLPVIMGIDSQIQQLFQNLVSNALKYQDKITPRVEVSYSENPDHWLFQIKDNGIGFDTKYAEKIFIIFQRLHEKSEYSGTGIGLAICKKIVEKHGGKIWVESTIGQGSSFYFTWPKDSRTME